MSLFSVIILFVITIQTICMASPAPISEVLPSTTEDDQSKWHITFGSGSGKSVEPTLGKSIEADTKSDDSKWHITFGTKSLQEAEEGGTKSQEEDGKWHITFGTKSLQEAEEEGIEIQEEEGKWYVTIGSKIYILPSTFNARAGDTDSSHNISNNLNGLTFGINARPDNSSDALV